MRTNSSQASKLLFALVLLVPYLSMATESCKNSTTTPEINACIANRVQAAEQELAKYLDASRRHYSDEPTSIAALNKAQESWLLFRKAHCDAIYEIWSGGTIRSEMRGRCQLEQTRRRTHDVWEAYLTFMDSTPPLLPDPKLDDESQFAATISGSIVGGGGIDDIRIDVTATDGRHISAYCDNKCGPWFTPPDQNDVVRLKKGILGKKVLLKYAIEPSRGRIAGLLDNDSAEFVKKVKFVQ